ncbi:MAG: hypothetical protein U0167_06775 [bacterium]
MPADPREPTKTCPGCGSVFTLQQILSSPDIEPIGMQFIDPDNANNMYYFNHQCPSCGSTFVVPVNVFLPFIAEPVPDRALTGTEVCERHCLRIDDLNQCHAPCHYAPFRRFLLRMRERRPAPVSGNDGKSTR